MEGREITLDEKCYATVGKEEEGWLLRQEGASAEAAEGVRHQTRGGHAADSHSHRLPLERLPFGPVEDSPGEEIGFLWTYVTNSVLGRWSVMIADPNKIHLEVRYFFNSFSHSVLSSRIFFWGLLNSIF